MQLIWSRCTEISCNTLPRVSSRPLKKCVDKKRNTLMSIYLKSMTSLAAFALIVAVLWDSNFVKLSIAPLSSADWVSIVIQ